MIDRLGNSVPFPGIDDPTLTAETLTKHLQDGINKWTAGDHEAAAESLKVTLDEAVMNPAIIAADPTLRSLVQRAYIARAVSLYRLKRTKDPKSEAKDPRVIEAIHAIADLVRMTPQSSIQDIWGTGPDKVFKMSRDDLVARGTGSLSIHINDPTAVFYLNVAGQPYTGVFAAEVLPGVYQVFVADAAKRSRRYRVVVLPHQHTILNIDWRRDTKIEVSSAGERSRIGFTFASFVERRREADYVSDIATRVPGSLTVVVGRIQWEGKEALIGAMYEPEQAAFRVGVVLGNELRSARDLAFFLVTDKPAPHVIKLATPPWESPPVARDEGSFSSSTKWIVGGGLVAIAAGVTLYAIDRDPNRNTAPYGAERAFELDRIIDAYAVDAGAMPGGTLTLSDREWIRSHESRTLAQIEKATRRFVAMRIHGITRAADLLGLSHSTLSEWVARRTLDISVDGDSDGDGNGEEAE